TDSGAQPRGKQVSKPGGIWYTPVTGIWQTVWLEPVNHGGWIRSVRADTDLDKDEVAVRVEMGIAFGNQATSVEVLDGDTVVAKGTAGPFATPIKMPNAKRWTPDTPHLYKLRVSAVGMRLNDGRDEVESYFAFREIKAAKDENGVMRLMLNNKP